LAVGVKQAPRIFRPLASNWAATSLGFQNIEAVRTHADRLGERCRSVLAVDDSGYNAAPSHFRPVGPAPTIRMEGSRHWTSAFWQRVSDDIIANFRLHEMMAAGSYDDVLPAIYLMILPGMGVVSEVALFQPAAAVRL
jgi:hypothetical protein